MVIHPAPDGYFLTVVFAVEYRRYIYEGHP